jgi:hypothetical protein
MSDQPNSDDETRATARLPGLEIEIVHRQSPGGGGEQISTNLRAVPSFEASGRFLETANPFCGHVTRRPTATALETRFKPPAHLAMRLPASHMTVSQADPTGSMTPWRQS